MATKHFIIGHDSPLSEQQKETVKESIEERQKLARDSKFNRQDADSKKLKESETLKHTEGRIVIKIDLESKDVHTFESGEKIFLARGFDNFNRRYTEPVNAVVISGEGIEAGSDVLVHHNAATPSNQITDYKSEADTNVRYYSILANKCFAWNNGEEWVTLPPYEKALRVFKPYKGIMQGIEPELIKDTLYVLTGDLKGQVVKTVDAADYEIIFQDRNGRENRMIRFRPNGDEKEKKEPEAICILHELTERVNGGEIFVGLTPSDAKSIK